MPKVACECCGYVLGSNNSRFAVGFWNIFDKCEKCRRTMCGQCNTVGRCTGCSESRNPADLTCKYCSYVKGSASHLNKTWWEVFSKCKTCKATICGKCGGTLDQCTACAIIASSPLPSIDDNAISCASCKKHSDIGAMTCTRRGCASDCCINCAVICSVCNKAFCREDGVYGSQGYPLDEKMNRMANAMGTFSRFVVCFDCGEKKNPSGWRNVRPTMAELKSFVGNRKVVMLEEDWTDLRAHAIEGGPLFCAHAIYPDQDIIAVTVIRDRPNTAVNYIQHSRVKFMRMGFYTDMQDTLTYLAWKGSGEEILNALGPRGGSTVERRPNIAAEDIDRGYFTFRQLVKDRSVRIDEIGLNALRRAIKSVKNYEHRHMFVHAMRFGQMVYLGIGPNPHEALVEVMQLVQDYEDADDVSEDISIEVSISDFFEVTGIPLRQ